MRSEHNADGSPFLKMERAARHVSEMMRLVNDYWSTVPVELAKEVQPTGAVGLRFRIHRTAPREISLAFGDVLHNLRSALDHLVWQLVLANGATPTNRNMFPIAQHSHKQFHKTAEERLQGTHAQVPSIVMGFEPWPGGAGIGSWLALLHRLEIADKHKLLVPMAAFTVPQIRVRRVDNTEAELPSPPRTGTDGDLVYDGASGDYSGGIQSFWLGVRDPDSPSGVASHDIVESVGAIGSAVERVLKTLWPYVAHPKSP